jgi:hypothetical protein
MASQVYLDALRGPRSDAAPKEIMNPQSIPECPGIAQRLRPASRGGPGARSAHARVVRGFRTSSRAREATPVGVKSAGCRRHASTHVTWKDHSGENRLSLLLKGIFQEKSPSAKKFLIQLPSASNVQSALVEVPHLERRRWNRRWVSDGSYPHLCGITPATEAGGRQKQHNNASGSGK